MRVFLTAPRGKVSGVTTVNTLLAQGLNHRGADARILVTDAHPEPSAFDATVGTPVVRLARTADRLPAQWAALRRLLRSHAPCVYVPNGDSDLSVAIHGLPGSVATMGILHADDPVHYEHVDRLGRYWNAIVAVSQTIAKQVVERHPDLEDRLHVIHSGVALPFIDEARIHDPESVLKIVFAGGLKEHQKRVSRLPELARRLVALDVPFVMTLVGSGPDEEQLRDASRDVVSSGHLRFAGLVPLDRMQAVFSDHHVFLLMSDFEGLPMALLEAMAAGCVPVVSDIPSGIPEVIEHDVNGSMFRPDDIEAFAQQITHLHRNRSLLVRQSAAARSTIEQDFSVESMVSTYHQLLSETLEEARRGGFTRPRSKPRLPLHNRPLIKHYLPNWLRNRLAALRARSRFVRPAQR